jgi:hypothetical protein
MTDHLRAAAVQAVQIAAVEALADPDHTGLRATLGYFLRLARGHGLTVPELCDATGLDGPYITRLLEEAHPR